MKVSDSRGKRQQRRTWDRPSVGDAWRPWGVYRRSCGCWWDLIASRMWEPCMAHEGEGHLSAVSEQDGLVVARCLVRDCSWKVSLAWEHWAVAAAQQHWTDTVAQHT